MRLIPIAAAALLALPPWSQPSPPAICGSAGLRLPLGFCASVFADGVGPARHLTVAQNGDVFVALSVVRDRRPAGSIVGIRDSDGDGKFDTEVAFGERGADEIEWAAGRVYVSSPSSILRYDVSQETMMPVGPPDPVVEAFANEGLEHDAKTFAILDDSLFVSVAAPSNTCQEFNRRKESRGLKPCPQLRWAAGIWRFSLSRLRQKASDGLQVAAGIRNAMGLAAAPGSGALFAVQHGRDLLSRTWPGLYSDAQNAELPSDEMIHVTPGANFGWPYCYHDAYQHRRVLAPEYGGDGLKVGECAAYANPAVAFPAHSAPNDLTFYKGTSFPSKYRSGAFVALHGGWGREPYDQRGFAVVFVPFEAGTPIGGWEVFAEGFTTKPVRQPRDAAFRPTGLAVAPDGALFVSDSRVGRVWRITYGSS